MSHRPGMSPLMLVQERVSRDLHFPWRVIVCCALLNQTGGVQVRPMVGEFFHRCPHPADIFTTPVLDLLEPLGMQYRRMHLLLKMTKDYLARVPPSSCHGVGTYASDALALFCECRIDIDEPADTWLGPYLKWRKEDGKDQPIEWDQAGWWEWFRNPARPVR